jgi:hypothetical protein
LMRYEILYQRTQSCKPNPEINGRIVFKSLLFKNIKNILAGRLQSPYLIFFSSFLSTNRFCIIRRENDIGCYCNVN